jgi:hypothetical protein
MRLTIGSGGGTCLDQKRTSWFCLRSLPAWPAFSTVSAAGSVTEDSSRNDQGEQIDPSPTPADPNLAPNPGCEAILRVKPGACDPDQPVQLDITGDADAQARVDQVQAALDKESGLDGGLKWDHDRRVLVVRLVGPIDGSSPAVEHAKATARAAP